MIKAIFFDIDGTLVSFNTHRIPDSTLESVRKVRQLGVKVFIATGRPIPLVNNLGELEYDGIMSASGGSCITKEGEIICHKTINRNDLERLVSYSKDHPFPIAFASDTEIFITETTKETQEITQLLNIDNYGSIRPIEYCLNMDVMQIIAFLKGAEEQHIMENVLPQCDAYRWHPLFVDAVARGTSKASGVDLMLSHYGIKLEDSMAFGDGGNDIEMLMHVPNSIAMGNANANVKKNAKYTTDTVDNDGIAKALHNFFDI